MTKFVTVQEAPCAEQFSFSEGSLVVLAVLFVAHAQVQQVANAQAQSAAQAPRFEVDPFWPKPLPNHWLLGNAIGVWADAQDNVWIVHRGIRHARRQRKRARDEVERLLRRRARRARVRSAGQLDQTLGWPRSGLRLAVVEPRHLRRPHRHGVDRRQRTRRLAHHEVHAGRQVRRAVRQAEREADAARTPRASRPSRQTAST